jgi:ATP-dependent protease HslVU (ClpYQ) peptidase subunit
VTTIAARVGERETVLAADTQITCGDGSKMSTRKIHAMPDGSLVAFCGDSRYINRVRRWLARGAPRKGRPRIDADEFDMLVVKPDGSLWGTNDALDLEPIEEPFFSIGSGRGYAMGAMARGATPKQAVRIAARYDINTGVPIDEERVTRATP